MDCNYFNSKGTRMELQLKDGRYDFLPVLNLLLYAVPIASKLSSTLHFPPLEGYLLIWLYIEIN